MSLYPVVMIRVKCSIIREIDQLRIRVKKLGVLYLLFKSTLQLHGLVGRLNIEGALFFACFQKRGLLERGFK